VIVITAETLLTTTLMESAPEIRYVDKLPTELWLKCFHFCRNKQFRRLSRVCRYFHNLAQPLLFETQTAIAPDDWAILNHSRRRSATIDSHRTFQRLTRLVTSPHVSSVRIWDFLNNPRLVLPWPTNITNIDIQALRDAWIRVLDMFKSTLGSYQRLTTLYLRDVVIDKVFWDTLASLPVLEDLTFKECEFMAIEGGGLRLPLRNLTVGNLRQSGPLSHDALDIVMPATLQRLVLDRSSQSTGVLAALAGHMLPNLIHVKIHLCAANARPPLLLHKRLLAVAVHQT
jgi:hypothetical protein